MAAVGDILERKRKRRDDTDRIQLVGVNEFGWIATSLIEHGEPFAVDVITLVMEYGAADPQPPDAGDEIGALLERDEATLTAAAAAQRKRPEAALTRGPVEPHPDSPEGIFRATDEGDDAEDS